MNRFFTPLLALLFFFQTLTAQTDNVPPKLSCKKTVELQLGPTCLVTVWSASLIDSLSDNAPGIVSSRLRKRCTGTGYPESGTTISFTANDMGNYQFVEVWAQDASGNTTSCEVKVSILNLMGNCDPVFSITTTRPDDSGIGGVSFTLTGQNCIGDTIPASQAASLLTYASGQWNQFGGLLEPGFTSTLRPVKKSNPLNGVSTFDLVEIQRHILGLQLFDAPWKIVAADANLDGKVTMQDVALLQKLILGKITELPHGQSWRFYPKDHVFQNPTDPFQTPVPHAIVVPNTTDPVPSFLQFTGVKIGDVNASADPGQ
ncbi:MAG: dockerin type I domain-containing protein [Saprospiraceae bacterium]